MGNRWDGLDGKGLDRIDNVDDGFGFWVLGNGKGKENLEGAYCNDNGHRYTRKIHVTSRKCIIENFEKRIYTIGKVSYQRIDEGVGRRICLLCFFFTITMSFNL